MKREVGYKKLIVWQNAYRLRRLIYDITTKFPKLEIRRITPFHFVSGTGFSIDCFDDGLIDKDTFLTIDELAGKTEYLFKRLIQSLIRKRKNGIFELTP